MEALVEMEAAPIGKEAAPVGMEARHLLLLDVTSTAAVATFPAAAKIDLKQRSALRRSRRSNTSQGGLHHPTFEKYATEGPRITEKFRREESREQHN
ncbi:hypothetical protein H5410_004942 [Solanum commersonii]|uniref:Uncharacterized protein n=1 Tax=Solanum commersonii TaxID=4109 RepID=A0A9J6A688_SOLCO|nr:hypothetical protein H5410_004942 [Solanum commersonii]